MLTIHNLESQFDVAGDDDAVFARLFAAHIRRWSQRAEEERCRARDAARERSVDGDPPEEER
jgi:uncharacterized membrane protein